MIQTHRPFRSPAGRAILAYKASDCQPSRSTATPRSPTDDRLGPDSGGSVDCGGVLVAPTRSGSIRAQAKQRTCGHVRQFPMCRGPFSRDACDAVKRISAKRFLPAEAPGIPMPRCDAARCTCRYAHHPDRRQDDRRHPFAQQASQPPPTVRGERRKNRNRRKSAKTAFRPKVAR